MDDDDDDDDDDAADVAAAAVEAGPRAQPHHTTPQGAGEQCKTARLQPHHSTPQRGEGAEGNSAKQQA